MATKKIHKDVFFLGLPEKEQDKMIKKAIRASNREQKAMVDLYEKKFGKKKKARV